VNLQAINWKNLVQVGFKFKLLSEYGCKENSSTENLNQIFIILAILH